MASSQQPQQRQLQPKKIFVVFGTRPEAIKMAPVVKALRAAGQGLAKGAVEFETKLIVTGQHRGLLDVALKDFDLRADVDLKIMDENQTLSHIVAKTLQELTPLLQREKPDLVVVHGDTSTSLGAALAAFHLQIPVAHVEAGLRSHNFSNPFPEEMNRTFVDQITRYCFAPTKTAKANLIKQGINKKNIFVTGNTIVDALQETLKKPLPPDLAAQVKALTQKPFVLITCHRRESFGEPFENILKGLQELSSLLPDLQFLYPVHPNPNVKTKAHAKLGGRANVRLLEPLDYRVFSRLLEKCEFILTDSGGIQEEAAALKKPVLVLREASERPEVLTSKIGVLVGSDAKKIVSQGLKLARDTGGARTKITKSRNPFGDGTAARQIVEILRAHL